MSARYELGLIGAGNMAEAIVRGVLGCGLIEPRRIIAADPSAARREVFAGLGVEITADNAAACDAEVVLLAVKPQVMDAVLTPLAGKVGADSRVITIAAGISTRFVADRLGGDVRVVRVMPNTPMLVGRGASGLAAGRHATPEDLARAEAIFAAAGTTVLVDESLIDAITAVSGSGPAYFFYVVEAIVAAAKTIGLDESQALTLAAQTMAGAAEMLAQTGKSPADLRRAVTSPGGTTAAAIQVFDDAKVGEAIVNAVAAAHRRAGELGT